MLSSAHRIERGRCESQRHWGCAPYHCRDTLAEQLGVTPGIFRVGGDRCGDGSEKKGDSFQAQRGDGDRNDPREHLLGSDPCERPHQVLSFFETRISAFRALSAIASEAFTTLDGLFDVVAEGGPLRFFCSAKHDLVPPADAVLLLFPELELASRGGVEDEDDLLEGGMGNKAWEVVRNIGVHFCSILRKKWAFSSTNFPCARNVSKLSVKSPTNVMGPKLSPRRNFGLFSGSAFGHVYEK